MRILVVTQYFWPENFRINDLVDELSIPEKVELDVEYLNHQSFWFDLKILWVTLLIVIKRYNISH